MTKKCLDCKSTVIDDLESDMESEVPLWYKKAGNYSLLPKLLNCNNDYNPNKTELKEKLPKITEIEVKIPISIDKKTWVFYWSSLPRKELDIQGPESAYGDESNSGLLETDKDGKATLILNCPQPYRVNNITYPRHVHYTTLTEDNVWSDEIKTLVVYCHLDKEQFTKALQSKDHIIINALSEESFQEQSIPGTYNLPVGSLNPNNSSDKVNDFMDSHLEHYTSLRELIEQNKLDQKDIPIITYCLNPSCNASKELAKYIMNAGYSNVVEYPGGLEEWFDDTSSSDEEENTFFDDDKYNLENEYETIIINNIKYKHKLDDLNYILDEDDQKVGEMKEDEIIWDTDQEKENNEILIETTDEESSTSEEESSTSEEESSTSEEEEEEEEKKEKKGGGELKESKLSYDGIYICSRGGLSVSQAQYDDLFRGWGFSFL